MFKPILNSKLPKHTLRESGAGFTLLELVIALSVFMVGIMSAFTLALANLNTSRDNYNQLAAANLAREGIELVKNIRDNNWLKIEANDDCDPSTPEVTDICTWDKGLTSNIGTVAYEEDFFTAIADSDIDTCYNAGSCRLFRDVDSYHDHNNINTSTNLARLITLKAICLNGATETVDADLTCNAGTKIGLQVTSLVKWYYQSKQDEVKITENIYNWREYGD